MELIYVIGIIIVLLLIQCMARRENLCLCNQGQLPGTESLRNRQRQRERVQSCDIPSYMMGVV